MFSIRSAFALCVKFALLSFVFAISVIVLYVKPIYKSYSVIMVKHFANVNVNANANEPSLQVAKNIDTIQCNYTCYLTITFEANTIATKFFFYMMPTSIQWRNYRLCVAFCLHSALETIAHHPHITATAPLENACLTKIAMLAEKENVVMSLSNTRKYSLSC